MTVKTSFVKKALGDNLLDEVKELRRRVAALEVREGKDRGVQEAIESNAFDPTGSRIYVTDSTGTDVVAIDEGGIVLANSGSWIKFKDSAGDEDMYISVSGNDLLLNNSNVGASILFYVTQAVDEARLVTIHEDPGNANVLQLDVDPSTTGAKISIGGEVVLWGGKNGTETIFNDGEYDVDFRVVGNTQVNLFKIDAGLDAIGIGGVASNTATVNLFGGLYANGSNIRSQFESALADDAAFSFTPSRTNGLILFGTSAIATAWGLVFYNTATPATTILNVGTVVEVATGILGGTTGTDTKFTVSSHTDGKIYVENRTGGARNVYMLVI